MEEMVVFCSAEKRMGMKAERKIQNLPVENYPTLLNILWLLMDFFKLFWRPQWRKRSILEACLNFIQNMNSGGSREKFGKWK